MPTPELERSTMSSRQSSTSRPQLTQETHHAVPMPSSRDIFFLFVVAASLFVFWIPLRTLVYYARQGSNEYDKYSYAIVIPFVCAALLFFERRKIFARVQYGLRTGAVLLVVGLILNGFSIFAQQGLANDIVLSLRILSMVICWLGGFILCYGERAFRSAAFPLLFLLMTVPIPDFLLDGPISFVRYGSTLVCSLIFSLCGVPALREGFDFYLSNVTIEIAKECSGIHLCASPMGCALPA
jgi:exosortase